MVIRFKNNRSEIESYDLLFLNRITMPNLLTKVSAYQDDKSGKSDISKALPGNKISASGSYGTGDISHLSNVNQSFKLGEKGSFTKSRGAVQDFEQLKQEWLKKKSEDETNLFVDTEFPARNSSIFPTDKEYKDANFEWKRPKDIDSRAEFFVDGPSRFDVVQGSMGNCWFLAGLASLAMHPSLLSQVIPEGQGFGEDYAGIFHFRFWRHGRWVDVVIDDLLPTINRALLFSSSTEDNEFWCALVEKAYAKLHGSYEALNGGFISKALEDLTGGISLTYKLNDTRLNYFRTLLQAQNENALIGLTFELPVWMRKYAPRFTQNHMVPDHGYTVTQVIQHKEELLKLRNPWGPYNGESKGEWSDKWISQYVSKDEQEKLGFKDEADGEFYIPFKSVKLHFTDLNICYLSQNCPLDDKVNSDEVEWAVSTFEGEWIPRKTAGGCYNDSDSLTFWQNPQYRITLESSDARTKKCPVMIGMTQNSLRSEDDDNIPIGFYVFELEDPESSPIVYSCHPIRWHTISTRLVLKPGNYRIIPTTQDPNTPGKFILRVFSEMPNHMAEILPISAH